MNGDISVLRLVLGVARLGELDLDGWSRCHGLSATGEFVLDRLFRRTASLVALELDIASASQRHNDALGRPTAVHLFSDQLSVKRLSLEWLGEQKLDARPHELVRELALWDQVSARLTLAEWAGVTPVGQRLGDGLRLGTVTHGELAAQELEAELACELAAVYPTMDASAPAFPYYDLV